MLHNLFALIYIVLPFVGLCFVFKKAGMAPWKALVPVYNIVLWIKLCGKNWKWYIYFLIPAINIFTFLMLVVETAKVFGRHKFWEHTLAVIFPFAYMPYLGLNKMEYLGPEAAKAVEYSSAREWLDAIVFALIAAMLIRGKCFEFYKIPSSSMEKSLLVGDYLMVSKLAYGPRATITPLALPLIHNVVPLTDGQVSSFLPWIKMPYHRYPGLGEVERFDATVFNYPDGDTVCTAFQSNASYYDLLREFGREAVYNDHSRFGKIVVRPIDKRENFIKRCIGLPGETLEIRSQQVFINGNPIENPNEIQYTYAVKMRQSMLEYMQSMAIMGSMESLAEMKFRQDEKVFRNVGVSEDDLQTMVGPQYLFLNDSQIESMKRDLPCFELSPMEYMHDSLRLVSVRMVMAMNNDTILNRLNAIGIGEEDVRLMSEYYTLPLTKEMAEKLRANAQIAEVMPLSQLAGYSELKLFPHAEGYSWSIDNFGPLQIPAKGMTVKLDEHNLPIYRRAIWFFEGNDVELRDGKIYINGEETDKYTFKMNYYWMMGDNRHNSADSRYWGFVPEDHIVGRASMVIFSRDKDFRKIRWNRLFKCKF